MWNYAWISGLTAATLVLLWHWLAWNRNWLERSGWKKPALLASVAAVAAVGLVPLAGLAAAWIGLGRVGGMLVVAALFAVVLSAIGARAYPEFNWESRRQLIDGKGGLPDADTAYETLAELFNEREKRVDTDSDADKIETVQGVLLENVPGFRVYPAEVPCSETETVSLTVPARESAALSVMEGETKSDADFDAEPDMSGQPDPLDLALDHRSAGRHGDAADLYLEWLSAHGMLQPDRTGMVFVEACAALRDAGRLNEVPALLSGPCGIGLSEAMKHAIQRNLGVV